MQLATLLAISILCIGLFGLTGINAANRAKEISTKKVAGANFTDIFILLNKRFVRLVAMAYIIAVPAAVFFMNKWLTEFCSKIEVGWELLAVSTLMGFLVALLTVSYYAIKASWISPIEC